MLEIHPTSIKYIKPFSLINKKLVNEDTALIIHIHLINGF